MDSCALIASIQKGLAERQGVASLALQNHLYGCFIVMEDIAQGVLEVSERHLTGNALYLNLDTQFGQIGVRYYGFTMDGKAIVEEFPVGYKEAWLVLFDAAAKIKDIMEVDRVEEEVLAVIEKTVDPSESYFMNALEYEGNLSPDWVERALYLLHPQLGVGVGVEKKTKEEGKRGRGGGRGRKTREKGRGLSMTRRRGRSSSLPHPSPKLATTRRRTVREREEILLDARE